MNDFTLKKEKGTTKNNDAVFKRKTQDSLIQSVIGKAETAINQLVSNYTSEQDSTDHSEPVKQSLEKLIGQVIESQLNQLPKKEAKKKRKLIMLCLTDFDSDSSESTDKDYQNTP